MSSINIIAHVEDFTSSGLENIFYHLKSHCSAFIHSKDIKVIDTAKSWTMFTCKMR